MYTWILLFLMCYSSVTDEWAIFKEWLKLYAPWFTEILLHFIRDIETSPGGATGHSVGRMPRDTLLHGSLKKVMWWNYALLFKMTNAPLKSTIIFKSRLICCVNSKEERFTRSLYCKFSCSNLKDDKKCKTKISSTTLLYKTRDVFA